MRVVAKPWLLFALIGALLLKPTLADAEGGGRIESASKSADLRTELESNIAELAQKRHIAFAYVTLPPPARHLQGSELHAWFAERVASERQSRAVGANGILFALLPRPRMLRLDAGTEAEEILDAAQIARIETQLREGPRTGVLELAVEATRELLVLQPKPTPVTPASSPKAAPITLPSFTQLQESVENGLKWKPPLVVFLAALAGAWGLAFALHRRRKRLEAPVAKDVERELTGSWGWVIAIGILSLCPIEAIFHMGGSFATSAPFFFNYLVGFAVLSLSAACFQRGNYFGAVLWLISRAVTVPLVALVDMNFHTLNSRCLASGVVELGVPILTALLGSDSTRVDRQTVTYWVPQEPPSLASEVLGAATAIATTVAIAEEAREAWHRDHPTAEEPQSPSESQPVSEGWGEARTEGEVVSGDQETER